MPLGPQRHQVALDPHRVGVRGPAKAPCQAPEMGVHRDARQAEGLAQHHIRRLAPNAGQSHQFLESGRHLPSEAIAELLAQGLQARGLCPEEASRMDDALDVGAIGASEISRSAVFGEELGRHLVDPAIGALGAQDRRSEQLQGRGEVQLALDIGVLLLKGEENGTKSPLLGSQFHHYDSVSVYLPTSLVPAQALIRQNVLVDEVVMGAPLFAALDTEGATALRASLVERTVVKGEVLFAEGEPGDRMYVIVDGKVKLGQTSVDGRESLLAVLGPGEMFGELSLFDPGQRTSTATALTDAVVLGLGNDQLRPWLAGRPEVATALLQALARRLRRTNEAMADLVFSDVPGRVAKALMDLGEKFGTITPEGLMVTHDMTQEELAQLVGASRETVNKALADFAQRGWIRLESRQVLILDVERLGRRAR